MASLALTKDWTDVPITTGTLENDSGGEIEISADGSEGLIIYPRGTYEFKNCQLKARTKVYKQATIRVVGFTSGTGGNAADDGPDNEISEDDAHNIFNDLISKF